MFYSVKRKATFNHTDTGIIMIDQHCGKRSSEPIFSDVIGNQYLAIQYFKDDCYFLPSKPNKCAVQLDRDDIFL